MGVTLNVPLAVARRDAAVREALSRVQQRRAEWAALTAEIQFEVQEAQAQVLESQAAVELFRQRPLPAAEASDESADVGYVAGSVDFLRVIEGQRQLIVLREGEAEALAEFHRRWALLERAVAMPLGPAPEAAELVPAPPPLSQTPLPRLVELPEPPGPGTVLPGGGPGPLRR